MPPFLTPAAYLQQEAASLTQHEYRNGDVVPKAGVSDVHVTVAGNLFALLRSHVRGSDCRVYISDMKVRLETCNAFYYPDVLVTCDAQDRDTATYKRFPKLIVEVLSDSTEAFDRGDKFAHYRTLDSLEEYIIISTRQPQVECFRRTTDNLWLLQIYGPEAKSSFELKSLRFKASLAALYEDFELRNRALGPLR